MWWREESTKSVCPSAIGGQPKTILSEYREPTDQVFNCWLAGTSRSQLVCETMQPKPTTSFYYPNILFYSFFFTFFNLHLRVCIASLRTMNRSQDLEGAVDLGQVPARRVYSRREAALHTRHNGIINTVYNAELLFLIRCTQSFIFHCS